MTDNMKIVKTVDVNFTEDDINNLGVFLERIEMKGLTEATTLVHIASKIKDAWIKKYVTPQNDEELNLQEAKEDK